MFDKEVIGGATLYRGDCLEIMPTLHRVDAIVTDPPYGVDFKGKATKWTMPTGGYIGGDSEDIGPRVIAWAIENDVFERAVVTPGTRLLHDYPKPYDIGFIYTPSGSGRGRWGFVVGHPILYYGKALTNGTRSPNGFESFALSDKNGHPCPKPVVWMDWLVNKATLQGQTVLDPFMGSGTTGIACANLGRKFIGIELEQKYFDIACERIYECQKQERLFA